MVKKLTSRKFLMALAGLISGLAMYVGGDKTEGAITMITSIVGYCLTEGIVDAVAVQEVASIANQVAENVTDIDTEKED